jgi:hypothetical protein
LAQCCPCVGTWFGLIWGDTVTFPVHVIRKGDWNGVSENGACNFLSVRPPHMIWKGMVAAAWVVV